MKNALKSVVYGTLNILNGGNGALQKIGGRAIRFPARWSRCYESNYEPATFSFLRKTLPKIDY